MADFMSLMVVELISVFSRMQLMLIFRKIAKFSMNFKDEFKLSN